MNRFYLLLVTLAFAAAVTSGAYLRGRHDGKLAERAIQSRAVKALNTRLREVQANLRVLEVQYLTEMDELNAEIAELGRLANEDPNADRFAIGADSVQRLNAAR